MVLKMLSEGANVCGVRCAALNLGVLVGPLAVMSQARAILNAMGMTVEAGTVGPFATVDPPDKDKPCLN